MSEENKQANGRAMTLTKTKASIIVPCFHSTHKQTLQKYGKYFSRKESADL
jgi:hypothetical protein